MTKKEEKALLSRISTLRTKLDRTIRQRDRAIGRAREYRDYSVRYQKELAQLRRGA